MSCNNCIHKKWVKNTDPSVPKKYRKFNAVCKNENAPLFNTIYYNVSIKEVHYKPDWCPLTRPKIELKNVIPLDK